MSCYAFTHIIVIAQVIHYGLFTQRRIIIIIMYRHIRATIRAYIIL